MLLDRFREAKAEEIALLTDMASRLFSSRKE